MSINREWINKLWCVHTMAARGMRPYAREAQMSPTIAMPGKAAKQESVYTVLPFMENSIACRLTRSRALGNGGRKGGEGREKGWQRPWGPSGVRDGRAHPRAVGERCVRLGCTARGQH